MEGLLMFSGVRAYSISYILFIQASWTEKKYVVAEEHKGFMGQVFDNGLSAFIR